MNKFRPFWGKFKNNQAVDVSLGEGKGFRQVIELKSESELLSLRETGCLASDVLEKIGQLIKPGISAAELDRFAESEIEQLGAAPAFKGYRGYPASLCVSINDEVVHGLPRVNKCIQEGDLVSIDLGVYHQGYYGDVAATFAVGRVSPEVKRLQQVARGSLSAALEVARPGGHLGDISAAIQHFVEDNGFTVVKDYVGHGIGRELHEEPAVPNFGVVGTGPRLLPGLVIAIEPMVNQRNSAVKVGKDGWTVVTADGGLSVHFEQMIAVRKDRIEVLTPYGKRTDGEGRED